MPYEATCPKGHRLQVTEAHFGERVNCPTCGEPFVVPDLTARVPPSSTPPYPNTKAGFDPRRWRPSLEMVSGLSHGLLAAGRPMVALGLMLVLLARGCDSIGRRGVDRAETKAKVAKDQFDDDWKTKHFDLEDKIAAETAKDPTTQDQKLLAGWKLQQAEMEGQQEKDKARLERTDWRLYEINARNAKSSYQINGYWREIFFVFASIVLAAGLLLVSWTAEGAERWVSLVMLAIITVSLYIGGAAWTPLGH